MSDTAENTDTNANTIDDTEPSAEAWQALADATAAAIHADENQAATTETGESPETDNSAADENPNKREARYRTQLRQTEAERDQLLATVEALQRAEVERLAGKLIQKPGALWAANIALSDLLDDTGTVNPTKVTQAVQNARTELGLAATRSPAYVRGEGMTVHKSEPANHWENAFK